MIAFKPGLVCHMRARSRRPPQARQMPLTPSPPEPADRTKLLRPQPRPRRPELAPFSTKSVKITKLETRIGVRGCRRLYHVPRSRADHHRVDSSDTCRAIFSDTPHNMSKIQ